MLSEAFISERRGSVDSTSACYKAGPSLILGSAPQGGFFPLRLQAMKRCRESSGNGGGYMHCMNVIEWMYECHKIYEK